MVEKIERIARTALWFVLALVFIAIPIGVVKARSGESSAVADVKAELKKAEDRIADLSKPKGLTVFSPKSLGMYLAGLRLSTAEGVMNFTNATDEAGILCLKAVAKNGKSGEISESISACHEVKPYESNASITFLFAGGDLHRICAQVSDCSISVAPTAEKPKQ